MNTNTIASGLEIVRSVLTALNNGKIPEILKSFDDEFTFIDQALDLKFTEKERLNEFFEKSRELFPDTAVELVSTYECRENIIAEWRVTATLIQKYVGFHQQQPISFAGVSVIHIENERITHWSDYYDKSTAWRMNLAGFFTEWVEY
jgi:steroid delta-isomerase-like uncharacterized protein